MKNTNQWMALGTIAALTSFTSLRADNTAQVKVDTDQPKVETSVHTGHSDRIDRDGRIEATSERSRTQYKASDLIGREVKNNNNEKLGEVKDLVLDPQNGHVQYVVLAVGGFLGVGEKLLAVPYSSLRPSPTEDHKFIMNASRERVAQAPGFPATNWPDVRDPKWDGAPFWNELRQSNAGAGATTERGYDRSTGSHYGEHQTTGDKKVEVEGHVETK